MSSVIFWSFTGIFIFFTLVGFLLGLWRGWKRSLLRFLSIFISAFVAYFITVPITGQILKINFSKYGWVISGVEVSTVGDTISALLNKIPYVSDLINLSPTFKSFILFLPQIILNIVLFLIIFLILCFLMWIVYRIVARFVAPKKNKDGSPIKKHRLLGGGIGAVQGLLFLVVFMIPVLSIVNLVSDTTKTLDKYNSDTDNTETVYVEVPDSDGGFTPLNVVNTATSSENLDTKKIHEYLDPVEDVWVIKVFNTVKVGALADKAFDGFSKMDIKGTKTTLRSEVNTITNLLLKFDDLRGIDINNLSDNQIEKIDDTVKYVFSSPLLKNVIGEAVPNAASKWMGSDGSIVGLNKPDLGDNLTPVVDSLLKALSVESPDEVQKDFEAVPGVLKVTSQNGLLSGLRDGGDSAFKSMSDEKNVTNLIGAMLDGPALKQIIPSVFNTGLEFVYPLVDVPETSANIDETFYNKLIEANNELDNAKREKAYKDALKYYDVTIYADDAEELTPVPSIPFVTETEFNNLFAGCSTFTTRKQFENYFRTNNLHIKRGFVVSQEDLVITKKSSQVTDWEKEKVTLAKIFSGFYKVYDQNNKKEEGQTALDTVDFDVFANVLNNVRNSELLDDIDQELTLSFLQSSIMDELTIGDRFMKMVKNENEFETVNFTQLFKTLNIVQSFKSDEGNLDEKDVETLFNILTSDDEDDATTKDVILDMADKDNLIESGVEENQANAISTIVNGISENASGATKSESDRDAFEAAVNAMENSDTESFSSEADAKKFVNSLMGSQIVYNAVINNDNYSVTTAHTDWIEDACDEYYAEHSDCDTDKLSAIAIKCGTTWTPSV